MNSPQPKHRFRLMPKFSISDTVKGDYHFGVIARHVSDYAQDGLGKYSANLVIIALFRYIIQIGFTWNKSPFKYVRGHSPLDPARN